MHSPLQSAPDPAIGYAPVRETRSFTSARADLDVRTAAVALAVLGGLVGLTWFFRDMPLWIAAPLTALWLAWYGSLQHETIHQHLTSSRRLNAAVGACRWHYGFPTASIASRTVDITATAAGT